MIQSDWLIGVVIHSRGFRPVYLHNDFADLCAVHRRDFKADVVPRQLFAHRGKIFQLLKQKSA